MFFKALRIRSILLFFALANLFAVDVFAHELVETPDINHVYEAGENIKISVEGEEELTNDYIIDEAGMIQMPMIGEVQIAGHTAPEIIASVTARLQDGYIWEPIVTIEPMQKVVQKTGFYILGEVNNPGHYALPEDQLTILKAVAIAGGFTHRADRKSFDIMRNQGEEQIRFPNNAADSILQVGDLIIVKERFF